MTDGPITLLLRRRSAGDQSAESELAALIYAPLHEIAERQMRGERVGHSLSPTALVHEAWLRLAAGQALPAADRLQFYALAARRMRQVLVDHARRRSADKRGAAVHPVTLTDAMAVADSQDIDALALEQALTQLAELDPRKAQVVELRY